MSLRLEFLLKLLILFATMLMMSLITTRSFAFSAYETSPGIVEVRGRLDQGLVVTKLEKRVMKKKNWLYFCVTESAAAKRVEKNEKCFYGKPEQFSNIKLGARYRSIEYSLKNRLYNSRGHIAIGVQRYFYPALVVYQ